MKARNTLLLILAWAFSAHAHDDVPAGCATDNDVDCILHSHPNMVGCFPTNQPLESGDGSEGSPVVYYENQCKIGCDGIRNSDGTVSASYSRTYSCNDFNLPTSMKGSPCIGIGGREYIKAGFPTQLYGLKPSNYEETETTSGCASGTEGICRRVQLGNLVDGGGSRVNAPSGYFDSEKAVVRGMDFFITGTPLAGSGETRTTSVPNSKAIRIISVSAAEGTEVEQGDELYRYCGQDLQNLYDGLAHGNDPPTPLVISSSCAGAVVTAGIKGVVTLAPLVNRIYVDSNTSLDNRCIIVAQNTGGDDTERCDHKEELTALYSVAILNYPTSGADMGDQFSSMCGTEGCIYEDGVISQVDYNEYDFSSDAYGAQIAFDRYFSTTDGVQLHPAAREASGLILRAKCLHSTCRVDTSKSKPGLGDSSTDSNPDVSRSFSMTRWNASSKAHTLGPLEGLADWLNKVDVDTITVDISFDTDNTDNSLDNACPYAPDPDVHPKDHPLYCAPEDGHDWEVTYTLGIDPILKPKITDDNNCCTGYKQYACELQDEPMPTAEMWEGFTSIGTTGTGIVGTVVEWFERPANKQKIELTYIDHVNSNLSKVCPVHSIETGGQNYITDADCDGLAADSDDNTPSSLRNIRFAGLFGSASRVARSNARVDKCRYAPSAAADGCPLNEVYREVGVEYPDPPVEEPVVVPPVVEPADNTGVCSYEPTSLEGGVEVALEVQDGDWDLCAWDGNWADIQKQGYDNPQTDCADVPDFAIWAKSAGGSDGEDESFVLENGLDGISVCVVPYNDAAKQCRGVCYGGPIYAARETVAIEDDPVDNDSVLTWTSPGPGPQGWFFELNELPDWATKIVAVYNPNDYRLKMFTTGGMPPDPVVLGGVTVHGSGLGQFGGSGDSKWQMEVSEDDLRALGVPE